MSASTATAVCLGLGSKVVGRQNIKQKCIRYFRLRSETQRVPGLKLFLGENGLYVWGWQGQAGTGWGRLQAEKNELSSNAEVM